MLQQHAVASTTWLYSPTDVYTLMLRKRGIDAETRRRNSVESRFSLPLGNDVEHATLKRRRLYSTKPVTLLRSISMLDGL